MDKLNIELAFVSEKGNGSNIDNFVKFIESEYKGGNTTFDLISAYSRTTAVCAQKGFCADMSTLPYLNFDMPWWPESLIDVVNIDGKVYFTAGNGEVINQGEKYQVKITRTNSYDLFGRTL